ncbi:caspase-8-like [Hemitrygon akajei]|uniref:caspase-8-like n=1 Tax=Hemitrygon akajei TaxID=2704970 RepID=UPI003BFA01F8
MADENRHRLMKIAENLGEEEVRDLRFLCSDHIPAGKVIKDALELFEELEQQNLDIIPELLFVSQQFKQLSHLNMQKAEVEEKLKQPGNCKIHPYRVLLYNISKQIDDKELKGIIYLLNIPKGKCQNIKNFMDVCTELEKKENISPDNLTCLLKALVGMKREDLVKLVKNYQNEARDKSKFTNLENRSRRQNLRIIGLPEDVEERDPIKFSSKFSFDVFGKQVLDDPPLIDRVHRLLHPKSDHPSKSDSPSILRISCGNVIHKPDQTIAY